MNELNVLKRICRHLFLAVLLCAVSAATASAQVPTVTVDAKNVTIKELLQRIEANSQYTFAYIDADINPDKRVSVKAVNRSIASIIAEVLPNVNMEVKGLKIVLTAKRGGESQTRPAADAGRTVKGRVTDESGAPVIGATVILKGTTIGTATNAMGEYAIDIRQADAVLVYSLIGYNKVELALADNQTQADVTLKSEAIAMDNVVVVGYGVQNKRDVTTAISSIKAEDFAAMPTADFRDAMAAKMPGVQVLTLGGQPDGNVSIRIRGIQSATSGNDPLYVIDGVPCDARAFSNLESSDIESLEVLKDASAAAIYGSRGSCGVILITTKRGEGERPVVSYDGQFSVSSVSKTIDMLNAYEFAKIFKEARDGAYLFNVPTGSIDDPYEDRPQTYHRVDPLITAYLQDKTGTMTDTDWQDAIFRTAYSTKHSVSVSGRTKTLGYYIGANYLYREGTIIGSDFERYSLRANIDGKRNRLKYGVSFSPSYSKTNYISSDTQYGDDGVIASALMAPPVFPVYNTDGSYNWDMNGFLRVNSWDTQTNEVLNPVALALEIDDVREKINILGNAYVSYEFIKGLEYKFTAGGDYYSYIRNYYRPSYIPLRSVSPQSAEQHELLFPLDDLQPTFLQPHLRRSFGQRRGGLRSREAGHPDLADRGHRHGRRRQDPHHEGQDHRPDGDLQQQVRLHLRLVARACAVLLQGPLHGFGLDPRRRFVALRPQHPVGLFPGGLRGMAHERRELPARCEMGRRPENPRQRGTDR